MALAAKHEFQMSSMQQETESKRSLSTETNAPLQSDEPLQIVDEDLANDLVNDLSGCSVDTHSTSKISTFPSNTMTSSAKDIQSFQVLDYATDSAFSQDWRAFQRDGVRTHGNQEGRHTISFIPSSSVVCCYQLSYWHQVFGPRVEHIWMHEPYEDENHPSTLKFRSPLIDPKLFRSETQLHICRHIFIGEICRLDRSTNFDEMESKLSILPDYNVCIMSELFFALNNRYMTNYALSVYIFKQNLSRLTTLYPILQDKLQQLTKKVRLFKKRGFNMSSFECSKWILRSMSSLEKIFASEMPIVRFNSTLFVGYDVLEADKLFLARAITSFLQTHSYATVIGSDERSVNKFISTLALFLSDSERGCAAYCDKYRNQYVPDLHLQGLILQGDIRKCVSTSIAKVEANRPASVRRSSTSTASDDTDLDNNLICDELIIQSRYPSTLIDIRDRSVWQTRLYPEYRQLRADFLDANISSSTSLASLYKKSPSAERMRIDETTASKAASTETITVHQQ
eukprot:TRINITY_DN6835_c0_g1_i3.p1 TRINITY_DN6835_c0_g1~~TRINITY_DN6835_c0_g1_i3.p1  ORF type:complete len:512 (+),score=84.76 TRINITY_DN6835_c0_g1_i3:78-1613(+)